MEKEVLPFQLLKYKYHRHLPFSLTVQPFMVWKHPVRIHSHKKAVQPPEEAWKYINEGFYDDYTDTHNSKGSERD